MKVTFYSNFLTHHQVQFCINMQKRLGEDFKFVSTMKIFKWRLDLGFKDLDKEYDFVIPAYESDEMYDKAKKLALESDIVIIGSTTDELIKERLKQDKLTFRYRSRIFLFVDGFIKTVFNKEKMKLFYDRHIRYRKNKNLHLLVANGYGANDFNLFKLYKNKIYKWGYFLEVNKYDIEELINKKEESSKIQIVWVARFIKWKHPEIVLKLANRLKKQGYDFKIKMLGNGILENRIKEAIKKRKLEDVIEMVGQVPSDEVKYYMEDANILIGTSDSREGWGTIINEAMNAGCVVIANQKMGAIPFLIKHRENGMVYNSYKQLENEVKLIIKDSKLRRKISKNAYEYITQKWTAEIAVDNLLELFSSIINKNEFKIKEGPASRATNYRKIKHNLV